MQGEGGHTWKEKESCVLTLKSGGPPFQRGDCARHGLWGTQGGQEEEPGGHEEGSGKERKDVAGRQISEAFATLRRLDLTL